MADIPTEVGAVMRLSPVIPVLIVEDAALARPIAEALVEGGLRVLEVTLRTAAALEVISEMSRVEDAVVGAGTVLNDRDLQASIEAGARFIVSPGLADHLGCAAVESGIPFLPGISSAGDIMRGLDLGLTHFKFFPASTSGGIPALKALSAPFGQARFCPTGGVTLETAPDWLALPSVLCVGGSWLNAKPGFDHAELVETARKAAGLARG